MFPHLPWIESSQCRPTPPLERPGVARTLRGTRRGKKGDAEEGVLPPFLVGVPRRARPRRPGDRSRSARLRLLADPACRRRCRRSSRRTCTTATASCSPRSTARSTARSSRSIRCPNQLRDAVIAVEDHGFYQHPGIDPVGILRAAWTDLVKHQTVQGGSTITEQLVKQVYAGSYVDAAGWHQATTWCRRAPSRRRSARRCSRSSSSRRSRKDQILARYLNTIYLGHGAYGVQAAAQTYWGDRRRPT